MADENYTMEIADSLGTFTFPITPKFFPSLSFSWKRDGKEVAVTDTVPVEGWFSDVDQDALLVNWNRLRAISQSGAPTVFVFKKDTSGTEIYRFNKGHIQNLETIEEGGGFVNHINFKFLIQEERGVTFPELVNVNREDSTGEEVDEDGSVKTIFRRVVSATGENGNLVPARAFVLALEPSLARRTRKEIKETHFDGTVTGIWEFDTTNEENPELDGIKIWRERSSRSPGQRSSSWYLTQDAPVLLRGGVMPTKVSVNGHIEAYDEAILPDAIELTVFIAAQLIGDSLTDLVLDSPDFGAPYPIEFSAENPSEPILFGQDYSFEYTFGEADPSITTRGPTVRHVGNQG